MTSHRSSLRAFAAIVLAAALAACADTTAPEPVALEDVLADVADVETYSAMGATVGGVPMMSMQGATSGACSFSLSSQSFVCPPVTHNGVTLMRRFQLLDASNVAQAAFNPATTAAVRVILDVNGTPPASGGVTTSITHHSEQTVGGLLASTRTLVGTATSEFVLTDGDGTFTLSSATTTNLSVPATGPEPRYPTGTVTTEITSSEGGAGITVAMAFNGTSVATITRTIGSVTQTCTMNLATPGQPPLCS